MTDHRDKYLKGKRIFPDPIPKELSIKDLVDKYFNGYNAARIQEICHLQQNTCYKQLLVSLVGALNRTVRADTTVLDTSNSPWS